MGYLPNVGNWLVERVWSMLKKHFICYDPALALSTMRDGNGFYVFKELNRA